MDDIEYFLSCLEKKKPYLGHNKILFDILEGELLPYVENALKMQVSDSSFEEIKGRIAPINILKKIIDKLSKIYQQTPVRSVQEGTDNDTELLRWYEKQLRINFKMNIGNEFFNLFKTCLIEPFVSDGSPSLRIIPNDRFLVFSKNKVDPTKPTHVLICAGKEKDASGYDKYLYRLYSDNSFIIFDSDKKIRVDLMDEVQNPMGINPYGKLPFVYVNRSANLIMPKNDTDTLRMTLLLPILLSDLNYAVKYQTFSIMYGIDVDDQNIKMAPNSFWRFKSDANSDKKPEIGMLKPQVDIDQVLGLVQSELALWLNSRGIKPGAIGQLSGDNFASGISKMIDEMDTFEDRKNQVEYFKNAEHELWDLLLNYMHPVWVSTGQIETNQIFTPTAEVVTNFHEQLPMMSRGQIVADLKAEMDSGFISRKRAIAKLNPEMSDEELEALMDEIEDEKTMEVEDTLEPQEDDSQTQDSEDEQDGMAASED